MTKMKVLYIIIALLIAINIGMLLLTLKAPKHHPDRNRNFIIKQLNFDQKQIVLYDSLIRIHRKEIGETQEQIMTLKNVLYNQLNVNQNAVKPDSLIAELSKEQSNIEYIHYNHFLAIKKICNPQQLNDYENLTKELARLFAPPMPKHPHNK